jgi:hypothetical protein
MNFVIFQALLSKASSLDIFHSFKIFFIASSHVSLGRSLHFLCFQDDLEYHCVLVLQEAFVGYNQIIANDVGLASLELVLPQIYPEYHYF